MAHYILYDTEEAWTSLLPLTYTRPIALLRLGVDTLLDKWQRLLPGTYHIETRPYLMPKYGSEAPHDALRIPANALPTASYVEALRQGRQAAPEQVLTWPRDIFGLNGQWLRSDIEALSATMNRQKPSVTNTVIGDAANLIIHPTARMEGAILDVTDGPIYIAEGAVVMPGAMLQGPLAVCAHSQVKMGAKIYGDTTIGPWCKVSGEVGNTVFLGYSNKAHDGYVGNSVIGEWCNLGAGVNSSNLKNDYSLIKQWSYPHHRFMPTGLIHCGLIMGDHSRAGINTMFNTATVVGVGVSIYGSGFPRQFVASFLEGGAAGVTDVSMHRFFEAARAMMARRQVQLTPQDEAILEAVRTLSDNYK